MTGHFDLDFREETNISIPSIDMKTIKKFEIFLGTYLEREIKFPAELVSCFLKGHGCIPIKQCFNMRNGDARMICRFCTLLKYDDIPDPEILTWRSSECDIRYEYSLDYLMNSDPYSSRLDESRGCLVPFAVIDTAGHNTRAMQEMDLLCLDYEGGHKPSVVTWSFEESWADPDETIKVADSFNEFLTMLYKRPDDFPITNECEYF